MADIVQLKENGVGKYLKAHANGIDGIDGSLVKATGNETIKGVKNFEDGIIFGELLAAKRKATLAKKVYSSSTDPGMFASGSIEFTRDGNLVTCTFAFKPKNTLASGAKIVWSLGEFEPDTQIRIPTCEGNCYLYVDLGDGYSVKIGGGLTNAQWASGSISWIARNRI